MSNNDLQSLLSGMADQRERIDRLEGMIKDTMSAVVNLNERLSNISSKHVQHLTDEEIYERKD